MTRGKLPGDTLNDVAARLATADLVRREILRLEKVILQMEQGALYLANTEFGLASGPQMIELCRSMLGTEAVLDLAEPLYEASVGRGLDVGISGSPAARPVPGHHGRAAAPVPNSRQDRVQSVEDQFPAAMPDPADSYGVSRFSSPAAIISVGSPIPGQMVDGKSTIDRLILGVRVREREVPFASDVIRHARQYVQHGDFPELETYNKMFGRQAWRKKLFEAACEHYMKEAGSGPSGPKAENDSYEDLPLMSAQSEHTTETPQERIEEDVQPGIDPQEDVSAPGHGEQPDYDAGDDMPDFYQTAEVRNDVERRDSYLDPFADGGESSRMEEPPVPPGKPKPAIVSRPVDPTVSTVSSVGTKVPVGFAGRRLGGGINVTFDARKLEED